VVAPFAMLYILAMHLRSQLLPALLMAILVQAANASPGPPDSTSGGSKTAAVAPKGPEAALIPAMPADMVVKIMGKPSTVKPMKVQSGKAEIWVYSREIEDRVDYVQVSTPIIGAAPSGNGTSRMVQTGEKLDNRAEHHITTEVIELLMFNDHFVAQKASRTGSVRIY
jgi:hypothetical protein